MYYQQSDSVRCPRRGRISQLGSRPGVVISHAKCSRAQVQSLVQDPMYHGATKPGANTGACALEPRKLQQLKPMLPRACASQQRSHHKEKSGMPQPERAPTSPQQRKPTATETPQLRIWGQFLKMDNQTENEEYTTEIKIPWMESIVD